MKSLSEWTWSLRWISWIAIGGAMLAASLLVPPVQFDQSVEGFFPVDDPGIALYRKSRELFGSDDMIFVAYEDPELWTIRGMDRMREISQEFANEIPGVVRVESLDEMPVPWRVDGAVESMAAGRLNLFRVAAARATVGDVIRIAVDDAEQMDSFRARVCSHSLFRGVVLDPDGKMTALIVSIREPRTIDHKAVIRALRERGDAFTERHGLGKVAVAGPPVLVSDGFESLDRDNRTLSLIATSLMALTMLIAVRNPGWALLPLMAGWGTWQLVRTLLWTFDLRLTLSSGPIVAQTVVLCMPAASHLAMRFRENWTGADSLRQSSLRTLNDVSVPIAWCAATAAAGYFAAWLTSDVVPVSQFGLTMCLSNLASGLFSYLLAAGAMNLAGVLRRGRPAPDERSSKISRMTQWVVEHPSRVVLGFVAPSLLLATGMFRLELESNYINIFRARSRVLTDYRRIEQQLGGIGILEVVLPAPEETSLPWLKDLQKSSEEIRAMGPGVVSEILSAADLLLPERRSDLDPELLEKIVERKTAFLDLPKFHHLLERVWNREEFATRILVRIHDSAPADLKEQFLNQLDEWTATRKEQPVFVTGLSRLLMQITASVITTSFASALSSAGMIAIMLMLALRSPLLTLLSLLPTALAVGLVLGIMGWAGLKIDMTTALVSSVAIGLSVDDTFHCLLHWIDQRKAGRSVKEALIAAYASSGPGVVLSSSAVTLGFLASMTSEFVPTANFGWLVGIATLGGSVGNLFVLPAILSLGEKYWGREITPNEISSITRG